MAPVIYLDHNATSPLNPAARDAMAGWLADEHGNPSSVHSMGRRARAALERARREVASAVEATPLEVTFTAGGTEADALGVLGTLRALRAAGRPCGLLTSPLEHPAVGGSAARWAAEGGEVAWVEVDRLGRIGADAVVAGLDSMAAPGLVSLAVVNHELGNHYDVASLADAARQRVPGIIIHCDAVQGLGKVEVSLERLGVDLVSLSAHKIGGPAGIGALVHRSHQVVEPLIHGGHQERGRRPGTEAVLLAVGFGAACRARMDDRAGDAARMQGLATDFAERVSQLGAEVLGDRERTTQTALVHVPHCSGELLMMNLDLEGIAVSTGAACSVGTLEPSPVVMALGRTEHEARQVIRVSLGPQTTRDELDAVLAALPGAMARVREAA